ncbi:MAG TPA: YdcH family protein [Stellaceae bacterium]|nr:YdcH family protein [Stellaceae bacterium]
MSLYDRIDTLRTQHRTLEDQIDQEIRRPLPNMDMVHDLKRQKLRIKDELAALEHTAH